MGFKHQSMAENIHRTATGGWLKWALLAGVICFGFILPDSFSDHTKIVHFAAHMGMSFFVASVIYVICNILLRMKRSTSFTLLILITLVIGGLYKYWEISTLGLVHAYSFGGLLKATGVYTSMSQNTSGLLAAILLIELIFSRVRLLHHVLVPGSPLSTTAAPFRPLHRQINIPRV
jgi:hypothetical protein